MTILYGIAGWEDRHLLLDLYAAAYGKTFYLDWWKWWSVQGPRLNRTYCAEDTDTAKLVGAYSMMPLTLWLNGRPIKASLCNNVCTHPDYQGRGLFTNLGGFALAQEGLICPVSLGMPNGKALPGHLRVGWEVACKLPFLCKRDCGPRRTRAVEVVELDGRVERLSARLCRQAAFMVAKDAAWFKWRFNTRPNVQYRIFVVESGTELGGVAVCKRYSDGHCYRAHVVELLSESRGATEELMAAAETYATGAEELTLYTNPQDPWRDALLSMGYEERQGSDCLIMHGNQGPVELPDPQGAWTFNLSDNDVY